MMSLIGGLVALILGILGLGFWWGHFLTVLMGSIPLLLLLGGAIAVYGGITSMKDKMEAEKEKEIEKRLEEREKKTEKKPEEKKAEKK